MKTRKHFFSRRAKTRSENPKRNQTSPSRSEDEEYSIDTEDCPSRHTSVDGDAPMGIARKDSMKLDGIVEHAKSFSSNGSDITTASDMMKCLNALRIQDASVTTSTPTPSGASIPRLAPPPLSSKGSVHSNAPEISQSWPNLTSKSVETPQKNGASEGDSIVTTERREPRQWVAFSSEIEESSKPSPVTSKSRSVSLHAVSSGVESVESPSVTVNPSTPLEMHQSKDHHKSTQNNSAPPVTAPSWEAFGESAFPASTEPPSAASMETVKEDSVPVMSHRPLRPPPKPPTNKPQRTGSSTKSSDLGQEGVKSTLRSPWVDSDEDAPEFPNEAPERDNPFAEVAIQKRQSSTCSLASKTGDTLFQSVLSKHGAPQLELVETVNACFSGNRLTQYSAWGEVKFKLSGSAALSTDTDSSISSRAIECLELYHLVLRLKCVLHHVFLRHVIAKKAFMDWDLPQQHISRQSSLTMNEARKGLVESKVMYWNLARCYQEALAAPVTLMRYPVQPSTLSGPPLSVRIQWQKPRKPGQPVLVDVSLIPNRKLATSLWGVGVCLKGFDRCTGCVEALACPEAKWNGSDCTFEWSIPMIHPSDAVQHLRVKVTEKSDSTIPDYHFSASVRFVMPHATLSGTLLLGWLERKDALSTEPLFGEDSTQQEPDLIFCEKMCLSGNYEADINYGSQ